MKLKTLTLCLAAALASSSALAFFDTPTIIKDANNSYPEDLEVERFVYELDKDALPYLDMYYHDGALFTDVSAYENSSLAYQGKYHDNDNITTLYQPESSDSEDLIEAYIAYITAIRDTFENYLNSQEAEMKEAKKSSNFAASALKQKLMNLLRSPIKDVLNEENGFDSDSLEDVADAREDAQDAADDHIEDLFEHVFGDIEDDGDEDYGKIEYGDYEGLVLIVDKFKYQGEEQQEMYLIKADDLAKKTDDLELEDSEITLSQAQKLGLVSSFYGEPMYSQNLLYKMSLWLQ